MDTELRVGIASSASSSKTDVLLMLMLASGNPANGAMLLSHVLLA
jgi:hypothetical protein